MVQYFPVVTGSLTVTGSINVSGGITASGGITISGSIASASFASTASFVALAQSASNAVAAQTSSFANAFTVAGNLTAQTLVVQTITSSVVYSSGSNVFGNNAANTQVMTGSVLISGSINILNYTSSNPAAAIMVNGAISAISQESKFAYGTWVDPNSGTIYDAKFGGNQNGIAVRGTSFFSGSVGIGISSPAKKLDIYDTNTNATAQIKLKNSGTTAAAYLGTFSETTYLTSGGTYNSGWSADGSNAIAAIAMYAGNADSSINFQTSATNGTGPSVRMTINKNGMVGIGLIPTIFFQMQANSTIGNARVYASGYNNTYYASFEAEAQGQFVGGILANPSAGSTIYGIPTSTVGLFSTSTAIVFTTNSTERLRIPGDSTNIVFGNPISAPGECKFYYGSYSDPGPGVAYDAKFGGTSGGGIAVRGNSVFVGSVSKGGGSFRIDHPHPSKKDTHYLLHSFIEGPTPDLIYRGVVTLVDGTATINIDEVSDMTEGTFVLLNKRVQCFTTNESGWDLTKGKVEGNILTITSQNSESTDEISWMVIGERNDEWMQNSDMTDENGKIIVEKLKPVIVTE